MRAPTVLLLLLALVSPQEKTLRQRIDALVEELPAKDARVGVLVHSMRAGAAIYAREEATPLRLASNTKLLTTAAALCRLGPGFKFRTSVGTAGRDLHVFAGGDPNLSGRFHDGDPVAIFRKWADRIKASGIARVEKIVLHTGIFDAERMNPGWAEYDPWFWWSAPFGPLSLNDNCIDLRLEPGAPGEAARPVLAPDTAYVTFANHTHTVAGKTTRPFGFTRAAGTNTVSLRGEIAAGSRSPTYWVSVHDPTMYFGTVLKETLSRAGIEVAGKIEESAAPQEECAGFKELAAWESDLGTTIATCNQPSQNFYAEMILRTLGWKLMGKGTRENGLATVAGFLEKEVGVKHVSQADGSGLTRDNLAAPQDMVRLLIFMRNHKHAREFYESLPASGMAKSTLRSRMLAADVKGRVRAKTGHISGVSSLSGYVESLSGDTYVFSILVNGPTAGADRLQDRICELLVRAKGD